MSTPCKIGVDGGGTKTECILLDAEGVIMAQHLAPGCNPSQIGPAAARAILAEALAALLLKAKTAQAPLTVTSTLLCMAGNRAFWRETADALTNFGDPHQRPMTLFGRVTRMVKSMVLKLHFLDLLKLHQTRYNLRFQKYKT